jgi:hypothetical protein
VRGGAWGRGEAHRGSGRRAASRRRGGGLVRGGDGEEGFRQPGGAVLSCPGAWLGPGRGNSYLYLATFSTGAWYAPVLKVLPKNARDGGPLVFHAPVLNGF